MKWIQWAFKRYTWYWKCVKTQGQFGPQPSAVVPVCDSIVTCVHNMIIQRRAGGTYEASFLIGPILTKSSNFIVIQYVLLMNVFTISSREGQQGVELDEANPDFRIHRRGRPPKVWSFIMFNTSLVSWAVRFSLSFIQVAKAGVQFNRLNVTLTRFA